MKKKRYNPQKIAEKLRREKEISEYGKLISLRPSRVHKSKKVYKRSDNKVNLDEEC